MDPNTALEAMRAAMRLIIQLANAEQNVVTIELAMDLAEHCEALDEWLSDAGCLPAAWADAYTSITYTTND